MRTASRSSPLQNRTALIWFGAWHDARRLRCGCLLGAFVKGYEVDIGCFSAWSLRMASVGPLSFYAPDYFCDYPPGYMLLLWPVGLITAALAIRPRRPCCCCQEHPHPVRHGHRDVSVPVCEKARSGQGAAAFLGLFFAFNPAVLVTGVGMGAGGFAASTAADDHRDAGRGRKTGAPRCPCSCFPCSIKPQALLFVPVALVWLLASAIVRRQGRAQTRNGSSFGRARCSPCLPRRPSSCPSKSSRADPLWLIRSYTGNAFVL